MYTSKVGFRLAHAPSEHQLDRGRAALINPGAVGQSRDPRPLARYAVLDTARRRVSFRAVPYDHHETLRKLRAARLVPQVVLEPPQGIWRQVEKYKARWARYWAERSES
jgi:hypothetical protein